MRFYLLLTLLFTQQALGVCEKDSPLRQRLIALLEEMPEKEPELYDVPRDIKKANRGPIAIYGTTFDGSPADIYIDIKSGKKSVVKKIRVLRPRIRLSAEKVLGDLKGKFRITKGDLINFELNFAGEAAVLSIRVDPLNGFDDRVTKLTKESFEGLIFYLEELGIKPLFVDHGNYQMKFKRESGKRLLLKHIELGRKTHGFHLAVLDDCREGVSCSKAFDISFEGDLITGTETYEGDSRQLAALLAENGVFKTMDDIEGALQEGQLVSAPDRYYRENKNAVLGKKVEGLPYYEVFWPESAHYGSLEDQFRALHQLTEEEVKDLLSNEMSLKKVTNEKYPFSEGGEIAVEDGFEARIQTENGEVLLLSGKIALKSYSLRGRLLGVATLQDIAMNEGRISSEFYIPLNKGPLGKLIAQLSKQSYNNITKVILFDKVSGRHFALDLKDLSHHEVSQFNGANRPISTEVNTNSSEEILVRTSQTLVTAKYEVDYARTDLIRTPKALSSKIEKAPLPTEGVLEQFLKSDPKAKVLAPVLGSDNVALVSEKGSRKVYKLTFSSGFEREIEVIVDAGVPKNKVGQVLSHWPDNPNFYDLTKRIEFKTGSPDFKNEAAGMILKTAGTASIGPPGNKEKGVLRMYEIGFEDTFQHELGHFLAYKLFGSAYPRRIETVLALKSDGVSPTNYANTSPAESWAEAVKEYLQNDGGLAPGKEWVRERYSTYFKLIDEAIGVDPKTPDALLKLRNGMSAMGILIIGAPGAATGYYYLESGTLEGT